MGLSHSDLLQMSLWEYEAVKAHWNYAHAEEKDRMLSDEVEDELAAFIGLS